MSSSDKEFQFRGELYLHTHATHEVCVHHERLIEDGYSIHTILMMMEGKKNKFSPPSIKPANSHLKKN